MGWPEDDKFLSIFKPVDFEESKNKNKEKNQKKETVATNRFANKQTKSDLSTTNSYLARIEKPKTSSMTRV